MFLNIFVCYISHPTHSLHSLVPLVLSFIPLFESLCLLCCVFPCACSIIISRPLENIVPSWRCHLQSLVLISEFI
jgi:hypothetical protein